MITIVMLINISITHNYCFLSFSLFPFFFPSSSLLPSLSFFPSSLSRTLKIYSLNKYQMYSILNYGHNAVH